MCAGKLRIAALLWCGAVSALAHVGSPDIFTNAQAGPYSLLIAVRPPAVIPGVAQIEVQVLSGSVDGIQVVPLPLVGPGKNNPPTPDVAVRDKSDPRRFTASLWLMAFGSYEVRLDLSGTQGKARYAVPVPALSRQVSGMQQKTGRILFGLMIFLLVGIVSIAGAAVRDAQLEPGLDAAPAQRRSAWLVMLCALVFCVLILWLGNRWWVAEDRNYRNNIYKPLNLSARLDGHRLDLVLSDPGWLKLRKLDDLTPDHDHLMHLFLVRKAGLDRMAHLHPDMTATGRFSVDLPAMDAGHYLAYADIVHDNGLAETATCEMDLPAVQGGAITGDDSEVNTLGLQSSGDNSEFVLEPGIRMTWESPSGAVVTGRAELFKFAIHNAEGERVDDLQPYMGMSAHAEFVRSDGKVFAHIHPAGSAAMAAMMLAQPATMNMDMPMGDHTLPGEVSFPYGIPAPGRYRVFVQVRRHGIVQTGVFDFTALDKSAGRN